jgi:exodeoxyribonuclease VII small subunit
MPNTPAPVTPNEASFESVLQRLQAVVSELESGDLPLEQALVLFEEGVRLSRVGTERLDKAEARIDELLGKEGFRSLEPPDLRDGNPQRTTKETR